ncbi:uncharacterized protein LOC132750741 [Ruditapes philippinarum]|uniref:uncharacterized protein LOC132750741 n=1 Tax=Ruditapes philippinarum TaxID=129788 RepID=UPI00295B2972|nr:uncharacterized protein LOC132750741 [Ruditapes philippinarum]
MIFSDHKTSDLILKCDTAKNRRLWLKELKQAHKESQPFSADSGYGSGGSVPSSNWKESERASTMESNDLNYSYAGPAFAQTKEHGRDNNVPSCSNEVGPMSLYVNTGKDLLSYLYCFSNVVRDYKRSAKDEDTTVTEECDRNTDITCVKESLPSSVQETKCTIHELVS